MKYNQPGQQVHGIAFNSQGRVSGDVANITVSLSKDGGPREPLDNPVGTEIGTTGEYVFELTQEETNGYALSFSWESSTPSVQILGSPSNLIYTVITTPPPAVQVTILPGQGRTPRRNDMTELVVYEQEEIIQVISVFQDDGSTPYDLSGKTLELVMERASGTDAYVYDNDSLTVSGEDSNLVSFPHVVDVTQTPGTRNWTLWSLEPRTLILNGTLEVRRASNADNS